MTYVLWTVGSFVFLCLIAMLFEIPEWKRALRVGQKAMESGDFVYAEHCLLTALRWAEEDEVGAAGRATIYSHLVSCYARLHRLDEAIRHSEEELAFVKEQDNGRGLLIAEVLSDLVLLHHENGSLEKAEQLCLEVMELREKAKGRESIEYAIAMKNLAEIRLSRKKDAEVESLLRSALTILDMRLGGEHPELAEVLTTIAEFYRQKGQKDDAIPFFQRAIHMQKRFLGKETSELADLLNNLGAIRTEKGQYDLALACYQEALAVCQEQSGQEDNRLAPILNNLATLYMKSQRWHEAEEAFAKALRVGEQDPMQESANIITLLENYAGLLERLNKKDEAKSLRERVSTIRANNT